MPFAINWLKVSIYLGFIILTLAYGEFRAHQIRVEWETSNNAIKLAVDAENAVKEASLSEANQKFSNQQQIADEQTKKLDKINGDNLTLKKAVQYAYSAHTNSVNNDSMHDSMRQPETSIAKSAGEITAIPEKSSSIEPVDHSTDTRLGTCEAAAAGETVVYNICVSALDAVYIQFSQPIIHTEE